MIKIFILLFPLILLAQSNYVFGPSVRVNDDPAGTHNRKIYQRSIACHGDTVYLAWGDNRYGNPSYNNSRVFFSKSTDAGSTWSPNIVISQDVDNYPCAVPHICLDGLGNIYVAYWGQNGSNNNSDIFFTRSSDGGITFSVSIMVNDSAVVQHQRYPACAVDTSGQHV